MRGGARAGREGLRGAGPGEEGGGGGSRLNSVGAVMCDLERKCGQVPLAIEGVCVVSTLEEQPRDPTPRLT